MIVARLYSAGVRRCRATITARTYTPAEAVKAGFLDEIAGPDEFESALAVAIEEMESLNPAAHAATKLRVRADAVTAVHEAIESELNG